MCELTYRCCIVGATVLPAVVLVVFSVAVALLILASALDGDTVLVAVGVLLLFVSVAICIGTGVLIRKYTNKKKRDRVISGDGIVVSGIPPPNTTYNTPPQQGNQPTLTGSQPPSYSAVMASDMQKSAYYP